MASINKQFQIPPKYLCCAVCEKKYNQLGSHANCYKSYCWICRIKFSSDIEQQTHSIENHSEFYCTECKECISNLPEHIVNKKKWCVKYKACS